MSLPLGLALALLAAPAPALEGASLDLELDAYYSALGLTVPFREGAVESDVEDGEAGTYLGLLSKALVPRFMVLEASVNPMPVLGVVARDRSEGFYRDLQLNDSLNLLDALTAGFDEPYALSLFLGKVIDFEPGRRSILGRAQKGYVGYLISGGNYHIVDSTLFRDDWLELEAKLKGDRRTEARAMSFSFRVGTKMHDRPDILDVLYLGIRRSRTDFKKGPLSWLLSSTFEYRVDFSRRGLEPLSHFVLLQKNLPTRGNHTFSLGLGYLWRGREKYSGVLAERRGQHSESQVLIRPNWKF